MKSLTWLLYCHLTSCEIWTSWEAVCTFTKFFERGERLLSGVKFWTAHFMFYDYVMIYDGSNIWSFSQFQRFIYDSASSLIKIRSHLFGQASTNDCGHYLSTLTYIDCLILFNFYNVIYPSLLFSKYFFLNKLKLCHIFLHKLIYWISIDNALWSIYLNLY